MTIPTGEFDRRFVEGFAQLLAAAGIGVTWRPDTPYTADETGIGLMALPGSENRAVALTPYPLTDDPVYADSEIGLQVLTRSAGQDPRDVWALDNAISGVLLGRWPLILPTGVDVRRIERGPSGSLGRDDNQRWLRSSNYPCLTYRPTAHRV